MQKPAKAFYKLPFSYHDLEVIRAALQAAGFTDLQFNVLPLDKEIPKAADFAQGFRRTGQAV